MKLFTSDSLHGLPLRARLAGQLIPFDIQMVRFATPARRPQFRQTLRASIQRLREEIRRAP